MNEVYVLQIRRAREEYEIFLFESYLDAKLKVFEYFEEKMNGKSLEELEIEYFNSEKGYWDIYIKKIHRYTPKKYKSRTINGVLFHGHYINITEIS